METMKDLHELCETISRAINTANEKIRGAGGKVSNADMEYIDRLTHSLKSVKGVMALMEAENDDDYSERYSSDGSYRRGYSRDYRYDDSYARGRGMNARRDSMGRYSNGYGYGGDMAEELRALMQDAPDEQTRQEFQRLIQKIEQR